MKTYKLSTGEILGIDWADVSLITYKKGHELLSVQSNLVLDFKSGLKVTLTDIDADTVFNGLSEATT